MAVRGLLPRILTVGTILSLLTVHIPVSAETAEGSLSGTVVTATDHAPLGGAKVHAGDPKTGRIYSSQPTAEDGSFSVEGLPASGYELAVEKDGGLYLVQTPVQVAPGTAQILTVAVNQDKKGKPDDDDDDDEGLVPPGAGGASLWDNQFTAAGFVIGLAFVVGVLIENATDDPDQVVSDPAPAG